MEIRRTYNPLTLHHDLVYKGLDLSPNQVIERENLVFPRPVVLLVNGEPRLRQDWDEILKQEDICHFVELPGISGIIAAVVWVAEVVAYAAISYGIGYLCNMFFGKKEQEPISIKSEDRTTAPAYNLMGGRNEIRIGTPYPEHFGRFICFPDLLQTNYTEYVNSTSIASNNQYMYMLGIIGVGEYSVEDVYIGTTPITDYDGASYNIISPSGTPTLVPKIVYTSPAISGQEITTDYLTVAVSAPGTKITHVGFDVVFPSGLVHFEKDGSSENSKTYVNAQIRKIDDDGTGLTTWETVMERKFEQNATHPLRFTMKYPVFGPARYEFRIKRLNARSYKSTKINQCVFEALRGYGASHPDYGDVTLIECKIKATEKLNGDVSRRINVVCTRKLYPVTATGFGITKAATRSIVDACAYIVTADNGGQQSSSILEFDELYALKTILDGRSDYFDYRFIDKGLALDACLQIAKCGRSIPIMPGGLFTLVRDKVQTTPTQIYTDDDYNPDSLDFNHAFRTDDDSTCVEVEYIDSDTWQSEIVQCIDVGGSEDNPIRISLKGCTNRQQAYEEGMYAYKDDELNRTAISFITGLKGLIPRTGDMIYVASRQTDWGQPGQIAHATATKAYLSEPVDFGDASEGKLLVTGKSGGLLGPYTVTPGDCAHSLTVALPLASIYTQHTDGDKASKFLFGESVNDILRVRTLKTIPISNNEIRVVGSIIGDEVHDDPGSSPDPTDPTFSLPILDDLMISYSGEDVAGYKYIANWLSSETNFKIELDIGAGYFQLEFNFNGYCYEFVSSAISLTLKVTPYIDGVLSPGNAKTCPFELPPAPTGVNATDDKIDVTITWNAVTGAESYAVRLENLGETVWETTTETDEIIFEIADIVDLVRSVYPTISVYISTRIGELVGPESSQYVWQADGGGTDTIYCKTFDDADVSGAPLVIRVLNNTGTYFYTKAYPSISVSAGETIDDIGSDLRAINDAVLSGTPKIAGIKSNDIIYYLKVYPTISAEVENSPGITITPPCMDDTVLSGTARVARIQLNSVNYYFKVYPIKT